MNFVRMLRTTECESNTSIILRRLHLYFYDSSMILLYVYYFLSPLEKAHPAPFLASTTTTTNDNASCSLALVVSHSAFSLSLLSRDSANSNVDVLAKPAQGRAGASYMVAADVSGGASIPVRFDYSGGPDIAAPSAKGKICRHSEEAATPQ